jgi:hypothetical protein
MRFTIADVVFVSESLSLTKEVFGKAASGLPEKYIYGHWSVDEMLSPDNDNTPTVLIILVTQALIASDKFIQLAEKISERMSKKKAHYFRSYIVPHDMSFDEFMIQCNREEALKKIRDVVHLDRFSGPDEVLNETVRFLDNEGNTRRYYGYVQFKNILRVFTGLLSGTLIWICTIASYSTLILYFCPGKYFQAANKYIADIFDPAVPTGNLYFWATIMLGITLSVPLANTLYLLRFGFIFFIKQLFISIKDSKSGWYFVITYLGFIVTIYFIVSVVHPGWSLILLSVATGCCLDTIRRSYYVGRRGFLIKKIDGSSYTKTGKKLKKGLLNSVGNSILHAFHLAYLPAKRARVFISYTHSCEWSQKIADELYENFNKQNVICFVDKYGIARGSSWRLALHEKLISEASHVICLVSKETVVKGADPKDNTGWPSVEIETALKIRAITGTPTIYVLLKEDMNEQEIQSPTPVYKEIFRQEKEKQDKPGEPSVPVIRNADHVVSELSRTLSVPDISTSVLGIWSVLWGTLLGFMGMFTSFIKGIMTVTAGIAFLTCLMLTAFKNQNMSSLDEYIKMITLQIDNEIEKIISSAYCLPVFLFACYLIAVELTQIIESKFYIAHKKRIKSYLISQLIVLSLSVIYIYMALPYLSEANRIVGFIFLTAGFFLTSTSNRDAVDSTGSCYYRNDLTKGMNPKNRFKSKNS